MFSHETIEEISKVAGEEGIEPAALLAVCEVESGGRAFAYVGDRREPLIRFEGHYFDRLIDPALRDKARQQGLAAPKWNVVKNPRRQTDRWTLLSQARRLDEDAALQSVSWGIGQVMGSHWQTLGYASPQALVQEARGSIAGQVRLMLRFIRSNGLKPYLKSHDWAGFARRYNGPGYKKNRYDAKMAAAYARHKSRRIALSAKPKHSNSKHLSRHISGMTDQVLVLQQKLTAAGFPVPVNGDFGAKTDAALRRFQKSTGLAPDGVYGPKSIKALNKAMPKLGRFSSFLRVMRQLLTLARHFNRLK